MLDLVSQLWHYFKKIIHNSIVGNLENWCVWVLVNGNNHLGVLHARQVLDGSADAHSNIEVRCHDLASLTDLHVVRHETSINSCSRGAYCTVLVTKSCGEVVEHLEVLSVLEAAASADDELGAAKVSHV